MLTISGLTCGFSFMRCPLCGARAEAKACTERREVGGGEESTGQVARVIRNTLGAQVELPVMHAADTGCYSVFDIRINRFLLYINVWRVDYKCKGHKNKKLRKGDSIVDRIKATRRYSDYVPMWRSAWRSRSSVEHHLKRRGRDRYAVGGEVDLLQLVMESPGDVNLPSDITVGPRRAGTLPLTAERELLVIHS